jgi:hypothetical protein
MTEKQLRDKIDDYLHTIYAIIGFLNFYLYDDSTKSNRPGVIVFQGRKFDPSAASRKQLGDRAPAYVTPDLGAYVPDGCSILGEVKKSFPADRSLWWDDFVQLISYDDELIGWPCASERVPTHDIALLVHQSRAVAVRKYIEERVGNEIKLIRPFALIQFNRTDERRAYFFFQRVYGRLSDIQLDARLDEGVPVPMDVFLNKYSTIKLYDAEPPLPYMIELIWTHVVLPIASDSPRFLTLAKNQQMEVDVSVTTIVEQLHVGFSFSCWHGRSTARQPQAPAREWVIRACTQLVLAGEAIWLEPSRTTIRVYFRKYEDVLGHFTEMCAQLLRTESDAQLTMFSESARDSIAERDGAGMKDATAEEGQAGNP